MNCILGLDTFKTASKECKSIIKKFDDPENSKEVANQINRLESNPELVKNHLKKGLLANKLTFNEFVHCGQKAGDFAKEVEKNLCETLESKNELSSALDNASIKFSTNPELAKKCRIISKEFYDFAIDL